MRTARLSAPERQAQLALGTGILRTRRAPWQHQSDVTGPLPQAAGTHGCAPLDCRVDLADNRLPVAAFRHFPGNDVFGSVLVLADDRHRAGDAPEAIGR